MSPKEEKETTKISKIEGDIDGSNMAGKSI